VTSTGALLPVAYRSQGSLNEQSFAKYSDPQRGSQAKRFWLPANTIMQDPEFKNDAAHAARFYKKPSRR